MRILLLVWSLAIGCTDGGSDDGTDACDSVDLSPCPDACPEDYVSECGEPCAPEGATCGNDIGDGRTCTSGVWECTVHAPLGTGCNLVCDPDA